MMNSENLLYEQRILELEKKLLYCTGALAESKNETGEFIDMAAHDLQAPLRKAAIFAERIRQKAGEGKMAETLLYIEKMLSAITSMQSLIDALYKYTEISTTGTTFIKCDTNDVLAIVKKKLDLTIKENKVEINSDLLPVIEADPERLKEMFRELLDNAIKFKNPSNLPRIHISSELVDEKEKTILGLAPGKTYFKITFTDNGIGFSDEHADKILKPFQRLHGKAAYSGNGLGLAICKKIIDLHVGILYARGNENSGARFVLILPETHN